MSTYDGPATIVAGDGTTIDGVDVTLVAPEQPVGDEAWFGTVRGDFDVFDLMDGTPSLRLPDGREASFRLSRTDLVLPRQGV